MAAKVAQPPETQNLVSLSSEAKSFSSSSSNQLRNLPQAHKSPNLPHLAAVRERSSLSEDEKKEEKKEAENSTTALKKKQSLPSWNRKRAEGRACLENSSSFRLVPATGISFRPGSKTDYLLGTVAGEVLLVRQN